MIRSAKMWKEVSVVVMNRPGALAEITKVIADHGIDIDGIAGYAIDREAKIMITAAETTRVVDLLRKTGYKHLAESEVVVVDLENKTGALKAAAAKLAAEKIDIKYTYGTACAGACPSRIIFSTSDNEKALVAFKK